MADSSERAWYSVAEVAQVLGVSRTTVWRWIRAGRLPARRVGPRTLRVEQRALDAVAEPTLMTEGAANVVQPAPQRVSETARVYDAANAAEQPATPADRWSDTANDRTPEDALQQPRRIDTERAARKRAALFKDYDPERVRDSLREYGGRWAELDTDAIIEKLYSAREAGTRTVAGH